MFKRILKFTNISSTQDVARRFVQKGEEIAVCAYRQKRGRGRHTRIWFSPVGGLYLSLLLFPRTRQSSIPLLASLVVVKVLEDHDFSGLAIQWPNDILLNNRKVCGVLCEEYNRAVICGIGLNVNVGKFPEKLEMATSMKLETGKQYDLEQILDEIINRFEPLYKKLQVRGFIKSEILKYITGIGEPVELMTSRKKYCGTVFGIDDDWALLLRDENGLVKKFYYGDVKRLRW